MSSIKVEVIVNDDRNRMYMVASFPEGGFAGFVALTLLTIVTDSYSVILNTKPHLPCYDASCQ